jgi:hypothetical protein
MNARDQYAVPELQLVGHTHDVVLGLTEVGADFSGEIEIGAVEFEAD